MYEDRTWADPGLLVCPKIVPLLARDCWTIRRIVPGLTRGMMDCPKPWIARLSEDCTGADPGLLGCPKIQPGLTRDCWTVQELCRG